MTLTTYLVDRRKLMSPVDDGIALRIDLIDTFVYLAADVEAELTALRQQLAASVPLAEHNRIVAQTITALDAERSCFEEQLAQKDHAVRTMREVNDYDTKYQLELEAQLALAQKGQP